MAFIGKLSDDVEVYTQDEVDALLIEKENEVKATYSNNILLETGDSLLTEANYYLEL